MRQRSEAPPPRDGSTRSRLEASVFLLVMVVVFMTHAASHNITSYDSVWTVHTAMSLMSEGNLDLDEYDDRLAEQNYREVFEHRGHFYLVHPAGTSIALSPLIWLTDGGLRLLGRNRAVSGFIASRSVEQVEMNAVGIYKGVELLFASLLVALTAGFLYRVLRRLTGFRRSLLLVFVFAFCTPAWSSASRALWSHDLGMLIMVITVLTILRNERRALPLFLTGAALGFSFAVRPTNAIAAAAFCSFFAVSLRWKSWPVLAGAAAAGVGIVLINLASYGLPLIPYYSGKLGLHPAMLEALAGSLVSPNRGLFVFCPVFLLSLFAARAAVTGGARRTLYRYLAAIIILNWLAIGAFDRWWGGHSYGPRLFTDVMPFLVLFLVPFVDRLASSRGAARLAMSAALTMMVLAGFAIHWAGANHWSAVEWNAVPRDVDTDQSRIWDWSDMQIVRALSRIPR